jgi:hypothetical protein
MVRSRGEPTAAEREEQREGIAGTATVVAAGGEWEERPRGTLRGGASGMG